MIPRRRRLRFTDLTRRDFAFIREIGANSIRLAHYRQSEVMYTEADKAGALVRAEIPFVNTCSGRQLYDRREAGGNEVIPD